jgi:hypothetical protein
MQTVAIQGNGQCGRNSSSTAAAAAAGLMGIKTEPSLQANTQGQLMHRAGSLSVPAAAQEPQQQQMPCRPGSSTGMAAQAAAMQAQSPEPQALSSDMSMLCAQLQQENMLLMHKLHQMETQMVVQPGQGPDAAVQLPTANAAAAAAAAAAAEEQSRVRSVSPLPTHAEPQQQQQPASSACNAWSGFDALMPQLRPVLTRVGGSAGGALSVGGSLGGMCPSSDLVAESPAQLINTAFLDDHGLLGSL